MQTAAQNRKHGRSTVLRKEMFLAYIWMSPERVSVGEVREGHSTQIDWKQKRRRNPQWRVWCEESGGWEYQKQSGEYGRVCKFEDSHRDKTEQCPWYICSRECFSCIEFVVRLGPSGEIETEVSFMFFQYEASSTVLHATKAMDRGSRQAWKERFAADVTE